MHTTTLLTALATMAISISATPINHNQAAAAASIPTPNAYAYAAVTPIPTPGATPGSTLPLCGNSNSKIPYQPTTHTCHPNGALCPIQNGTPLAACGQACYDARIYRCGEGDALELSPEASLRNGTGIFPPAGAVPSGTPPAIVVAGGTPTPTPGY